MQPDISKINIFDNEAKIIKLLNDLVFIPRLKALEWSCLTKQTPNLKIGYPGQHLASLITGIEGERTGARGNDLIDGTEVKSCSRVDQLDTCKDCKEKVLRLERYCSYCKSENIDRKKDSKWLFSIKNTEELKLLTEKIDRILLILSDYPNFKENNFEIIRIQAFEIWTKSPRNKHFSVLINDYYNNLYLPHIRKNPNKTPAPMNFWPDLIQFYLCNPIQVFDCVINQANTSPSIEIINYVKPQINRTDLPSVKMPPYILTAEEFRNLAKANKEEIKKNLFEDKNLSDFSEALKIKNNTLFKKKMLEIFKFIDEDLRKYISTRNMREAKELARYERRSI